MSQFNDVMAVRAAVLTITTDCQLRCSYCFEEDKAHNYMSEDDAMVIIEKLCNNFREKVYSQDQTAKLDISFFGGEPTLNFPVIEKIVEYCNQQEFIVQYGITTNCVHITDEMIEFFYDNNFGILVSIDGTKELHNRNRSNSYDTVVANIKRMFDGGLKLNMEARITIPPKDIRYTFQSMKDMYDLGFDRIAPCFVYDQEWDEEAYRQFEVEIRKIYEFAMDKYNSEERRNLQVKNIEDFIYLCYDSDTNDTSPCGFGKNAWVAIGYDGELTPCHQVHTNFRNCEVLHMGNMITDEFDRSVMDMINAQFDRSTCGNCKYNNVCLGGCPAESFTHGRSFNDVNPAVCHQMDIMYHIATEYQDKILHSTNLRSRRLAILKRNLEFKQLLDTAIQNLHNNDLDAVMLDFASIQESIFGEEKILLPPYIRLAERYIDIVSDKLLNDVVEELDKYQAIMSGGEIDGDN